MSVEHWCKSRTRNTSVLSSSLELLFFLFIISFESSIRICKIEFNRYTGELIKIFFSIPPAKLYVLSPIDIAGESPQERTVA